MNIGVRFIQTGFRFALDPESYAREPADVYVLLCRADSTISIPAGLTGCWWPIRGTATLHTSDYALSLGSRMAYVSDAQRSLEMLVGDGSIALALVTTPTNWNALLTARHHDASARESILSPVLHPLAPAFRRQLLLVLRTALQAPTAGNAQCVAPAMKVLLKLQEKFTALIERCPGRSRNQRRSVFLRLQRVRNLLSFSTDSELDMRQVAAAASYSLWRFTRVFAAVFGETPYAYVSRCRVDRAHKMLISGSAAVSDIAAAVGYETSVALSRAIRRHFGVPASQLRQQGASRAAMSKNLSGGSLDGARAV